MEGMGFRMLRPLVAFALAGAVFQASAQGLDAGVPAAPSARVAPLGWPFPGAPLSPPAVVFPKRGRKLRLYLDAGHGAANNTGNTSCTCENESDFTYRVAGDSARRLEATGHVLVRLSRKGPKPVAYPDWVAAAEQWGADAFVSIHSDARGQALLLPLPDGRLCPRQDAAPGFSVLWSDEGKVKIISRRHALARGLARRLAAAGFTAYDGFDYTNLYDGDAQPGVFVDRRPSAKRVFVLRKPTMPSVIIETHNAFDFEEVARWREDRTLEVFAAVVASALAGLSAE